MDDRLAEDASPTSHRTGSASSMPYRVARWLLGSILGLALLTYAYNGRYSRFWADDYCAADSVQVHGFIGAQQNWYETWTGRYSSVFFTDLFVSSGLDFLQIFATVLLGVWLLCLWWALRQFGRWLCRRDEPLVTLLLAKVLLLAYVVALVNRPESLYWVTGAVNYTLPLVFVTLYAGLIARAATEPDAQRLRPYPVAALVLALIAAGFSETNMVWQNLVLLLATAASLVLIREQELRRRLGLVLGAGLVGSIIGSFIVWLAPGNDVRQAQLDPHPPLIDALTNGLRGGVDATSLFLREPAVLIVGLVAAVLALWVARPRGAQPTVAASPSRDIVVALVLMEVVVAAGFVLGYYFLNDVPPERAWVTAQISVMATVAFVGYRLGALAAEQLPVESLPRLASAATYVAGVLVVAMALASALDQLDKRDALSAAAAAWDARDETIRSARDSGELNLVVEELVSETELMDVTRAATIWSNACIAAYYDIETIRSSR